MHPNYGSHITALFPERAEAARLLLQATVVAYSAFFELSWSEKSIGPGGTPLKLAPAEPWPLTLKRFRESALPALHRAAGHPIVAEVLKAPRVLEWLASDESESETILADPQIAALLGDLPRREPVTRETSAAVIHALWDGARPSDLLDLAAARRQEQLLTEAAPEGAPGTDEQARWLRFNRLSLGLAMLLDRTKANAFKIQLVRQIARENELAVLLCVRSLIEHRALARWLPDAVARSLDDLTAQVRANAPLPKDEASQLEQEIANFLTVQAKDFQGERRPWTAEEDGGVRKAWLNLGRVVKTAFPEDDRFRRIYALASAAVHGRFLRSLELSRLAEGHQSDGSLGVIVLERLCEPNEAMSPTFSAAILAANLDHAERFGGSERAATDQMARQVLGRIDQPLIAGVDYTGRGTERDPFRIAAHLQFHSASYALLEQLGVDLADSQRALTHDEDGNLFDRWQAKGREIWFHVDPLRYDATT